MRNKIKTILSIVLIGIMFGAIPAVAVVGTVDWQPKKRGMNDTTGALDEINCTESNPNTMQWNFNPVQNQLNVPPTLILSGSLIGTYLNVSYTGGVYKFITPYTSNLIGLNATVSYNGTIQNSTSLKISHGCSGGPQIPEFPMIALPIAAIIGLVFFFQHRKKKEE